VTSDRYINVSVAIERRGVETIGVKLSLMAKELMGMYDESSKSYDKVN